MTEALDPRRHAYRPDLAAAVLRGRVQAAHFVEGERREVIDAQAPVRRHPAPDAPLDTEALLGERVTVYEATEEGWSWVQLETDGYVGWLPSNALAPVGPSPTHKVAALRTLLFPGPSIKLPPVAAPSLGARLAIARHVETFAVTANNLFVPARHLVPLDATETDFVAVAERFLGTPYLWGGRTSLGLDCSGLVQTALAACGIAAPRDSDMQERELGAPVSLTPSAWRRGDLVFWKGHVAIVRDGETLLHANAFHMAVAIEPIADALARIAGAGLEPTSVRRVR